MLVSDYYSIKYSHNVINKDLSLEKKIIKDKTLNEYVKWKCKFYKKKYKTYLHLLKLKNLEFIRYNDFIEKPLQIDKKLLKIFEIKKKTKKLKNLFNEKNYQIPRLKKIDLYSHKKMGQIDIYKNQLNDETIKYLNKELRIILKKFNFNN